MGWIGGNDGVFRLHSSNEWCGSKISLDDAAEIFDVTVADLQSLNGNGIKVVMEDDEPFVAEIDLHKAWGKGLIPTQQRSRIGAGTRSFDELILIKLIQIVLPGAEIEPQAKAGRKQVDLLVSHDEKRLAVEFFGPSHFIQQYNRQLISPSERQHAIEEHLGCECVVWPYWIQRCELNVLALVDSSVKGRASVWSTKAHFGDFVFEDSADVIMTLTERFNAVTNEGFGYMYSNDRTPNKPAHPIVKKIEEGKEKPSRLIPRGSKKSDSFWLPASLVNAN